MLGSAVPPTLPAKPPVTAQFTTVGTSFSSTCSTSTSTAHGAHTHAHTHTHAHAPFTHAATSRLRPTLPLPKLRRASTEHPSVFTKRLWADDTTSGSGGGPTPGALPRGKSFSAPRSLTVSRNAVLPRATTTTAAVVPENNSQADDPYTKLHIGKTAKPDRAPRPWFMVNPGSRLKNWWDWLVIILVVFNAVTVPMQVAFTPTWSTASGFKVVSVLVDIIFVVDLVVSFLTGVVGSWGEIVYSVRHSAIVYAKGMLVVDLLAVIPFEAMAPDSDLTFVNMLKLPRLLRLGRLTRKAELLAGASVLRILLLLFGFWLLVHLCGCAYWFLGAQMVSSGKDFADVWFTEELYTGDQWVQYLSSLYFMMTTMTAVGYGEFNPKNDEERAFMCVVLILAAFASAVIFGNVAVLVQDMDKQEQAFRVKARSVRDFFFHNGLSRTTHDRTQTYVQRMFFSGTTTDQMQALAGLPNFLIEDIFMEMHRDLVTKVPMFTAAPAPFLRELVRHLTPLIVLPGDYLLKQGDPAKEMVFVHHGYLILRRLQPMMQTPSTHELGPGSFYGEAALMTDGGGASMRYDGSVIAVLDSKVFLLSRTDFQSTLRHFPEMRSTFRFESDQRLESEQARRRSKLSIASASVQSQPGNQQEQRFVQWLDSFRKVDTRPPKTARGSEAKDGPKGFRKAVRVLWQAIKKITALQAFTKPKGMTPEEREKEARYMKLHASMWEMFRVYKESVVKPNARRHAHTDVYNASLDHVAAVVVQKKCRTKAMVAELRKLNVAQSSIIVLTFLCDLDISRWRARFLMLKGEADAARRHKMTKQNMPTKLKTLVTCVQAMNRLIEVRQSRLSKFTDKIMTELTRMEEQLLDQYEDQLLDQYEDQLLDQYPETGMESIVRPFDAPDVARPPRRSLKDQLELTQTLQKKIAEVAAKVPTPTDIREQFPIDELQGGIEMMQQGDGSGSDSDSDCHKDDLAGSASMDFDIDAFEDEIAASGPW